MTHEDVISVLADAVITLHRRLENELMTKKDDGVQAFPVPPQSTDADGIYLPQEGMTLRDYFAGHAVAGWLASFPHDAEDVDAPSIATFVYEIADAMLKERAK
jgi:hypothetical protein